MEEIRKKSTLFELLDWLLHIGVALLIGFFIITYIAQLSIVNKTSMEPTLQNGDLLIVDKITPRFFNLKHGDIITVEHAHPLLEGEVLIKRLIAKEGDVLEFSDGKVYRNGEELDEPYIKGSFTQPPLNGENRIIIPEGTVYVLGDNREPGGSFDSREFGPVPLKNVSAKALIRIYPFKTAGILK